jgi:hypothetical protein
MIFLSLLVAAISIMAACSLGDHFKLFGSLHGVQVAEEHSERMELLHRREVERVNRLYDEEDMRRRSRLFMKHKQTPLLPEEAKTAQETGPGSEAGPGPEAKRHAQDDEGEEPRSDAFEDPFHK